MVNRELLKSLLCAIPATHIRGDYRMAKKRRGRPPTTGRGTGIMVRLHAKHLAEIDEWRMKNGNLSRPEAIRQLTSITLLSGRAGK
jgi:hypothetical protein